MTRFADGIIGMRFASRTESIKGEHFYGFDPECCFAPYPIDYFVWAVCSPDRVVLVDAGFTRETAARRGARKYHADVAALLGRAGRSVDEVTDVILTHLHYDHTGQLRDFPQATVWLQQEEFDFWQSDMAHRQQYSHIIEPSDIEYLSTLRSEGRLQLLTGSTKFDSRIALHKVGGHTPGLQMAEVTVDGTAYVLMSDASHFYENLEKDKPFSIVDHLPSMLRAFDLVRDLTGDGGIAVPGHDPRIADRHPLRVNDDEDLIEIVRAGYQYEDAADATAWVGDRGRG